MKLRHGKLLEQPPSPFYSFISIRNSHQGRILYSDVASGMNLKRKAILDRDR